MESFIAAVRTHAFLQSALLAGLLASVATGVVGSYVVVRRITYIAGSLAHCVLGGLGIARYLQVVWGWEGLHPLYGALAFGVGAAIVIGRISVRAKQREDTVIGALWAVGMAVGLLFISRTPGYNEDLLSYLFGNILMVSATDLWLMLLLDAGLLAVVLLRWRQLLAVCFDPEFAGLRGLSVEGYTLLLLTLTAVTVVLLVTVVGLVMVIALLTLPAAAAGRATGQLHCMMAVAGLLTLACTVSGLAISYGADLPGGATIVLLAAGLYLLSLLLPKKRRTPTGD